MYALFDTAIFIIGFYTNIVIVSVIASWLVGYGVIDRRNRLVMLIMDLLYRVTEPALQPIRRILPTLSGLDFSPLVLLILLQFLQRFIAHDLIRLIPY